MDYALKIANFCFCGRMPPKRGPFVAARVRRKGRRLARTMRASSLRVQGCALREPRGTLAKSEGRMPGDRTAGGVFLWLSFFAQALRRRSGANSEAGGSAAEGRMPGVKKVTRSPAGRVEALHFKRQVQDGFPLARE